MAGTAQYGQGPCELDDALSLDNMHIFDYNPRKKRKQRDENAATKQLHGIKALKKFRVLKNVDFGSFCILWFKSMSSVSWTGLKQTAVVVKNS